ncbi:hypothetical protein Purlil1_13036 [Purpureocillium lilacinum]|uniref:Uncharacterized protein n=1 Tax=Purpureocillium lilacinum TaxID=33203 RepID=A0ABR0BFJ2_PURLI|nr:hypothetical protein Purlil1_13036 [Purpureocillium lilacinum]
MSECWESVCGFGQGGGRLRQGVRLLVACNVGVAGDPADLCGAMRRGQSLKLEEGFLRRVRGRASQAAAKQDSQDEPIQGTSPRQDALNEQSAGTELSPAHEPMQRATGEDGVSGDSMQLRLLQEFLTSTDEGQSYSHSLDRLLELLTAPTGTTRLAYSDDDALGPPSPRDDTSSREDRSRTLSCSNEPNPPPQQNAEHQPAFACSKGSSSGASNGPRPPATDDLRLPPIRGQREPTVHLPSFPDRPSILASCGTGTCKALRPLLPKTLTPAQL